ncbi:MAG: hypothetical protein AABX11_01920 [Nanoarchaeota archaeon]
MPPRLKPQKLYVSDGTQELKILDEWGFVTGTCALDAKKTPSFRA